MKNTLAGLLLLALAAVCVAQETRKEAKPHPDLTGTWRLDKSKGGGSSKFDSTLLITHREPELRINRTDVRKRVRIEKEYVFYTDRRGESNPMYYGDGKFDSDTKWDGNKVVTYVCSRRYTGAKCHGEDSWNWKLSADGQTLTHWTTYIAASGSSWLTSGNKLVYRRAP